MKKSFVQLILQEVAALREQVQGLSQQLLTSQQEAEAAKKSFADAMQRVLQETLDKWLITQAENEPCTVKAKKERKQKRKEARKRKADRQNKLDAAVAAHPPPDTPALEAATHGTPPSANQLAVTAGDVVTVAGGNDVEHPEQPMAAKLVAAALPELQATSQQQVASNPDQSVADDTGTQRPKKQKKKRSQEELLQDTTHEQGIGSQHEGKKKKRKKDENISQDSKKTKKHNHSKPTPPAPGQGSGTTDAIDVVDDGSAATANKNHVEGNNQRNKLPGNSSLVDKTITAAHGHAKSKKRKHAEQVQPNATQGHNTDDAHKEQLDTQAQHQLAKGKGSGSQDDCHEMKDKKKKKKRKDKKSGNESNKTTPHKGLDNQLGTARQCMDKICSNATIHDLPERDAAAAADGSGQDDSNQNDQVSYDSSFLNNAMTPTQKSARNRHLKQVQPAAPQNTSSSDALTQQPQQQEQQAQDWGEVIPATPMDEDGYPLVPYPQQRISDYAAIVPRTLLSTVQAPVNVAGEQTDDQENNGIEDHPLQHLGNNNNNQESKKGSKNKKRRGESVKGPAAVRNQMGDNLSGPTRLPSDQVTGSDAGGIEQATAVTEPAVRQHDVIAAQPGAKKQSRWYQQVPDLQEGLLPNPSNTDGDHKPKQLTQLPKWLIKMYGKNGPDAATLDRTKEVASCFFEYASNLQPLTAADIMPAVEANTLFAPIEHPEPMRESRGTRALPRRQSVDAAVARILQLSCQPLHQVEYAKIKVPGRHDFQKLKRLPVPKTKPKCLPRQKGATHTKHAVRAAMKRRQIASKKWPARQSSHLSLSSLNLRDVGSDNEYLLADDAGSAETAYAARNLYESLLAA